MGIAKAQRHVQENFVWDKMHHDVQCFVSQCPICQQAKYESKKMVGLLQPLPILLGIWEDISMNFIIGLLPSHGFTYIYVIIDHYSKGAHFSVVPPRYSAYRVATLFMDIFCKLHGFPRRIVLEHDPIFLNTF